MTVARAWWAGAWWAAWLCLAAGSPASSGRDKLLYILMDGLRWDYVDQQDATMLPGFNRILSEGVRARWTNPLFPSISYPTWTTLATGLHAESHNIVGNWFHDAVAGDDFSLFDADSTGKAKWWTAEPIWTTAEKSGLRTAQFLWSRCDVPIDGVTTDFCEHFVKIPGKEIFETNIQRALQKFDDGYDFVQVYTEHTDNTGHKYGPDSEDVRQAMRDLDDVLMQLMTGLEQMGLLNKVNIVIVSDHGMTTTDPSVTETHEIDDYLDTDLVESMADKGAFMNIKATTGNMDTVYDQVSKIPGVVAYKHPDIPERYHFRDSRYIYDIILVAKKGHYIMASRSDKQLPRRTDNYVSVGGHGYDPDDMNMKGIFFARGPAFTCGSVVDPIHVVDVYQVLTHVLDLTPLPHNGTWSHVEPIFRTYDSVCNGAARCLLSLPTALLLALTLLARHLMTGELTTA